MDISVVIPAYNEIVRLPPTLDTVQTYLEDHFSSWEIIVSDDGSTDGTIKELTAKYDQITFLAAEKNQGKGAAVRRGMIEAKGDLILFSDADLSTPIDELESMESKLTKGRYDIVIASRGLPESDLVVKQPWWREISGRIFNLLVRPLSGLPYKDTQCGFKLFTRDAAHEIFARCQTDQWAFDVEVLMLAKMFNYKVYEMPVRWLNAEGSKVNLLTDAPKMALEIMRLRLRFMSGFYKKNSTE